MCRWPIVVPCVLAVMIPLTASAEPRRHDGGFFFRTTVGGGYSRSAVEDAGDRITLKGISGSFDFALGGTVKQNLAVHATLGGWGLLEPTVNVNGHEEVATDTTLTLALIGGGVTYYLGPSNVYLTASVGTSKLNLDFEGDSSESDWGVAFDAGIGKEWWVNDRWGIGLSVTGGYHSVPSGDGGPSFSGPTVALRFSATFN